jgi:hypothetical protein
LSFFRLGINIGMSGFVNMVTLCPNNYQLEFYYVRKG